MKGKVLLPLRCSQEGEEIAAIQSPIDTLLAAYHQDIVEESEKEEGDEGNEESLEYGRHPPLVRHGCLEEAHDSEADGWKLKEC